jgi:hypothetical protein
MNTVILLSEEEVGILERVLELYTKIGLGDAEGANSIINQIRGSSTLIELAEPSVQVAQGILEKLRGNYFNWEYINRLGKVVSIS